MIVFLLGLVLAFVVDLALSGLAYVLLNDVFTSLSFWEFFKIVVILGFIIYINASIAS